tara:strand:+ start:102 stop:542 length:441 start_codon:yes stop_codon:yes gene_type:complete
MYKYRLNFYKKYLEELEELDPPCTEMIERWVYNKRTSNHDKIDGRKSTVQNKILHSQKLLMQWSDFVGEVYAIPWEVYHYCASYLYSTDFYNDCETFGYDKEEIKQAEKELEQKKQEAEQCMERLRDRIDYVKNKIDTLELKEETP